MTENDWTWKHDIEIPSEKVAGERLVQEVIEQLQLHQWDDRAVFAVHLALEEAIVNAIKHGNGYDVSKSVHVFCQLSANRFQIQITDEGDGFDSEAVPDPTNDERLDLPSGRGVHLIRSFMSEVRYNDAGNSVFMQKQREI